VIVTSNLSGLAVVIIINCSIGDYVVKGDSLLELEIDKGVEIVEAETDGWVTKIFVNVDEEISKNAPLVEIFGNEEPIEKSKKKFRTIYDDFEQTMIESDYQI
jgi:pyruvate/2-oxoglutarate dehydrogenase complex dihydrolipoamide acyltransferase (E2) component